MDRREYLTLAAVGFSIGGAGCLGAAASDGAATPSPAGTPDYAGDVWLVLHNYTDATVTVRLSVATDGERIVEAERSVDPDGSVYVDPGIEAVGVYEFAFSVEGGQETTSRVTIERYDRRAGSNLLLWIRDDDVQLAIEE